MASIQTAVGALLIQPDICTRVYLACPCFDSLRLSCGLVASAHSLLPSSTEHFLWSFDNSLWSNISSQNQASLGPIQRLSAKDIDEYGTIRIYDMHFSSLLALSSLSRVRKHLERD